MTVIYNMSIDRADKPWIGDRRLTEWRRGASEASFRCIGLGVAYLFSMKKYYFD